MSMPMSGTAWHRIERKTNSPQYSTGMRKGYRLLRDKALTREATITR
jgi:hypothetical protein